MRRSSMLSACSTASAPRGQDSPRGAATPTSSPRSWTRSARPRDHRRGAARVYDCDGLTGWRAQPACVVLPASTEEVQAVVRLCAREPASRSSPAAPAPGSPAGRCRSPTASSISLSRGWTASSRSTSTRSASSSSRASRTSTSRARSRRDGLFYAPDPSSQQVCTIGGNVAENSGGAHCLKNGFTVNHVTGMTRRAADGRGRRARRQGARLRRRARPARRARRLGGNARHRDRDHAPGGAEAGGRDDAARRVPVARRGGRGRLGDRRRRGHCPPRSR